jgi:hypothetical protein
MVSFMSPPQRARGTSPRCEPAAACPTTAGTTSFTGADETTTVHRLRRGQSTARHHLCRKGEPPIAMSEVEATFELERRES